MTKGQPIKHLCVLAPPFLSHLLPMLSLSRSLLSLGVKVTVACSRDFQSLIEGRGFRFTEMRINLNANKGSAADTEQEDDEKQRLEEFFSATKRGAPETLSLQMRERSKDMFANPDEVFRRIKELDGQFPVDWWIVDQLSYSVTVSLMVLQLPFITFCPPHPASIPEKDQVYGVPLTWPEKVRPDFHKIRALQETAEKAESDFDEAVHAFLKRIGAEAQDIQRTFSLCSPTGIVYNYPDFHEEEEDRGKPARLYMGFSFLEEPLPEKWDTLLVKRKENRKIVFLSFGTFLSARDDVLRRIITGVRLSQPEVLLIVAGGSSLSSFEDLHDDKTIIEDFLPQKAILPYVDLVIHHGGVGTFTETLYNAKPAVVLPFSSDQFNVAADVEKYRLGTVLDPNSFTQGELSEAVSFLLEGRFDDSLRYWGEEIRSLGPDYTAKKLLAFL